MRPQFTHTNLRNCPASYRPSLEGTYPHSIAARATYVDYMIHACHDLPIDTSNEGIQLRRLVLELELCSLVNVHRPRALHELALAVEHRFEQWSSTDNEYIQRYRKVVSLCSEGHPERGTCLNGLTLALYYRFNQQGNSDDLNGTISLLEEVLRPRPVGHTVRDFLLGKLGPTLFTRFNHRGIKYNNQPPARGTDVPVHATTLNNLAILLKTRYDKLDASEYLFVSLTCFYVKGIWL